MDAKDEFTDGVHQIKSQAVANPESEIARKVEAAEQRKDKYKSGWKSVDLNEVVERLTPGAHAVVENGKITYTNKEETIRIVADAGGGYLRVEDLTVSQKPPHYLGINGEEQSNFVNERGKQQGRSKEDFRKATHFRIKKREEMNEQ